MTLADIRDSLELASQWPDGRKRNTCLLRPCQVSTLIEVDAELVRKAFRQIQTAIMCIESGVASSEDHAAEALLLQIFHQHATNT